MRLWCSLCTFSSGSSSHSPLAVLWQRPAGCARRWPRQFGSRLNTLEMFSLGVTLCPSTWLFSATCRPLKFVQGLQVILAAEDHCMFTLRIIDECDLDIVYNRNWTNLNAEVLEGLYHVQHGCCVRLYGQHMPSWSQTTFGAFRTVGRASRVYDQSVILWVLPTCGRIVWERATLAQHGDLGASDVFAV